MTTANVNILPDSNTAANFRSAGAAINAQLSAMGLVQTADTGQINWTTVANPGSNVFAGYEIWRFNDALQATVPVFIRVEYWGSLSSGNHYAHKIQIGFATDGAGNITGTQKSALITAQGNAVFSGTFGSSACLFSGAAGRIALALFPSVSDPFVSMFWSVERSKDAAGVDNGDAVIIQVAAGGNVANEANAPKAHLYLPFTGGVPNVQFKFPAIISNGPSAFGGNVQMGIPFPIAGSVRNPGLGALIYNASDFSSLTDYAMSVYGASHTFKTLTDNWRYIAGVGSTPGNNIVVGEQTRLAMRWE
jgi:hypothetical protein